MEQIAVTRRARSPMLSHGITADGPVIEPNACVSEEERNRMEAYTVARGRDLMRFYCSNDVTRPLFSVARRKTMDSIYRINWATISIHIFLATFRSKERVSVEKQSVARRRKPSWRVAATNGLMNLMEAPRYRVAGEPRWRITEAKEEKRKRLDVEREECFIRHRTTTPGRTRGHAAPTPTSLHVPY
ncbi:hypothetical protein ALC57_06959 [Trachymyrmex cornetzi]|uniref:Uncharacterized protein n=1 Tax=Trachymyrmex cornetzi TaxID=471704 RepID=A0A195E701_9HYME|nr:hypothetical protein ALC57_06959 [Trachymyrmex cornetzi]